MQSNLFNKIILVLTVCLLGLFGCRGINDDDDDGDDGGTIGDGRGELELWITDGPVDDARRVEIAITGFQVKPVGEDPIEELLDTVLIVDLLDLDNEPDRREEIIDNYPLPVGDYEWIRLLLDETRLFIEVDNGQQFPLAIPEEEQAGLQLPFNVQVEDDTDLDLTIDLDLRKSLRTVGTNDYQLHPSLRIVRTSQTGTLTGTVARPLIEDEDDCNNGSFDDEGNAVYVFEGGDAAFQDLRGDDGDPVATALVEFDTAGSQYTFTVGFLPRGSYTAVFTCDAAIDDPETNNELGMLFSNPINFSIEAGDTASIDFEANQFESIPMTSTDFGQGALIRRERVRD